MVEDRFKKISKDYAELWTEVFAEAELDYNKFQQSVFESVVKNYPSFKTASILDIGIGDGETMSAFVKARCENLTGIDLNPEMLEASKRRFGSKVKLIKLDATKLDIFKEGQFDIIITGFCIHNIPIPERKKFWKELLRLKPDIFVAAEKIADPDPVKHEKYKKRDMEAIIKVYRDKHNLPEVAKEWIDHYEYDETQKMTLDEINENLSDDYSIELVLDMGMNKTIVAKRKKV